MKITNRRKSPLSKVCCNYYFLQSYYAVCDRIFGFGGRAYYNFNISKQIRRWY